MAYKIGNRTIQMDRSFVHNEITYPRNWIRLSTPEEKASIGMVWEDDPVRASDVYYWNGDVNNPKALDDVNEVKEDGTPLYVQVWNPDTEQMEDTDEQVVTRGLKYTMKQQVKDTAGKMLASTDWYVVRNSEKSTAIPADVTTKRDAIRTECDRLETAIDGATTVDALKTVMESQDWGE